MNDQTARMDNVLCGDSKTVLTYGTFDTLHYGHIEFLKRAAALGNTLIVFVSTDKFNEFGKHKKAMLPYWKRKELVEMIKCVSAVYPEKAWDQKPNDVLVHGASVVVFGEDWVGKFDYLKSYGADVVYLPRTPEISSTMIRNMEKKNGNAKMEKKEENNQPHPVEAG